MSASPAHRFSSDRFRAALEAIAAELPPHRLDFDLHCHQQIGSTNTDLWERLDRGAKPGATTIAAQQTAGRGQWSRSWQSETGGLYLSTLLAPHLPTDEATQLTFASAWGIAMNLRDRGVPVELKWPNDLLLEGRKLGGILTEIRTQAETISHAVVGVGINWRNPTPETGISLGEFWAERPERSPFSLELLGAIVLSGIARGYLHWQAHGIEAGTTAYEALLFHRGRTVKIDDRAIVVLGVAIDGKLRARAVQNGIECEVTFAPGSIQLDYDSARSANSRTAASDNPVS